MSHSVVNKPLGRGLAALLGPDISSSVEEGESTITLISLQELVPGKYQPREVFDQEYLNSLISSIKEKGVIQPILVRPVKQGLANYEIVAGERRWKAAQIAGLKTIPAIIRTMTDQEALETGLIENIQRHDLNPLEEAQGFKRLIDDFHYTQEDLAKALGKSRSHISNSIRLLSLEQPVKEALKKGKITSGHARALINSENQEEYLQKIIQNQLSVRQTEKLMQGKETKPQKIIAKESIGGRNKAEEFQEERKELDNLVKKLTERIQRHVKLELKKEGAGVLSIAFNTLDELDALLMNLSLKSLNLGGED